MRRIAVVLVLILTGGAWPAAEALAHGSTAAQPTPAASLQADFNSDGIDDLAVGVPGEDVGSVQDAGAVNVLYGSAGGLTGTGSQLFTQPVSAIEPGDQFGAALAAGDFNNDTFADLAVGAPTEDVGSTPGAGAVSVLYGSAGGLTTGGAQTFTQVGSRAEPDDEFGFALAAGDFNNDTFADLAAGAPFESVGSVLFAGAVSVLPGSAGGLTTSGARLFTQPVSAVERDDTFGFALAAGDFNNDTFADLAAGAPFEDVGATIDAGATSALPGSAGGLTTSGARTFTQPVSAVEQHDVFGFALAAGDFNNDTFADLAAGAPFEDVGSVLFAGAVSALPGSAAGLTTMGAQTFIQVGGAVERDDTFGFALAAGDFNGDTFADLAAGAPFEDVGSVPDAGAVSAIYGSSGGLTSAGGQLFTQDTAGVPSIAEAGDGFGGALAAGDPGLTTAAASPSTSTSRTRRAGAR
jgi:hypothetical protein